MKKLNPVIIAILFIAIFSAGCKKTTPTPPTPLEPPVLTILSQSNLTTSSATIKFNIVSNSNELTEVGICYSTTKSPTTSSAKTASTVKEGTATVSLSNLTPNTKYYYRVYAVDNKGTTYYSDSTKRVWPYDFGLMTLRILMVMAIMRLLSAPKLTPWRTCG